MDFSVGQLIVWLIIGSLAGSLAGWAVTFKKEGFGRWVNLAVGMIGSLVGGALFHALKIDLGLGHLRITFEDLLSAFGGSLLLLFAVWCYRLYKRRASTATMGSRVP